MRKYEKNLRPRPFFAKFGDSGCNFTGKGTPSQVFSSEFYKLFLFISFECQQRWNRKIT